MPHKHCAYGLCKSDSRYPDRNPDVRFIPFPKPKTRMEECKMWIKACARPCNQLNPDLVRKGTYVCSKVRYPNIIIFRM